jgi:hypothetical protein
VLPEHARLTHLVVSDSPLPRLQGTPDTPAACYNWPPRHHHLHQAELDHAPLLPPPSPPAAPFPPSPGAFYPHLLTVPISA